MNHQLFFTAIFSFVTATRAAVPVDLEIVTQRGVQITAPHEWLQLLAEMGLQNVRIRGGQSHEEPTISNSGTAEQPRYRVVGVLTARDQLRLPGGTFSRGDRARLKDYLDRLVADGAEALTAPRGMFGLTESEMKAVFADLAQPILFETKQLPPRQVIDRLEGQLKLKFAMDSDSERMLASASPVGDEWKGLAAGTALAMMLRRDGLVMRPEKSRGQPVVYRVATGGMLAPATSGRLVSPTADRPGKPNDKTLPDWPIGWEPPRPAASLVPALFEQINAEIDGYTLQETLEAIGPRLKIPIYLDHAALAAHGIEPAKVPVRMPRTRAVYKRIIDRILAQARLGSQVRVDEAGTPFLWITR